MTARRATLLAIVSIFVGVLSTAPPPTAQADIVSTSEEVKRYSLAEPTDLLDVIPVVETVNANEVLVVSLRKDDWTGEVVLQSSSPGDRKSFIEDIASRGVDYDVVALTGALSPQEVALVVGGNGDQAIGVPAPGPELTRVPPKESRVKDCDECWEPPYLPAEGRLRQWRADFGWTEETIHTFSGLDAYPYSQRSCYAGLTRYTCLTPAYAYEHDYKILANGYVDVEPNYFWESNLPGAYRDTRASETSPGYLDFTIGSAHTWLLDDSKRYSVRTAVDSGIDSFTSHAKLEGQLIVNDLNCEFVTDSNHIPIDNPSNDPNPWCFGLDVRDGAHAKYIDVDGFSIEGSGSCWDYVFGHGYTTCGFMTANSASLKQVGTLSNTWGTVDTPSSVRVWTEALTPNGYSRSQERMTGVDGSYVIPLTYGATTPGTHTFRVAARHTNGEIEYSRPFDLRRVARPTVGSVGSKPIGEATYAWGTVDGGEYRPVWTEVWIGNRWSKSQQRSTDGSGYYTIPLTYGASTPGVYRYRVASELYNGEVVRSHEFTLTRTS